MHDLFVAFYADVNGRGAGVGIASALIVLKNDGSITNPDGTPCDHVATSSYIRHVTIAPNQVILISQTNDLIVTAMDNDNNLVAVSPGPIFLEAVEGADKIRIANGQVEGLSFGAVALVATINEERSIARAMIVSRVGQVRTIDLPANDLANDPVRQRIYVSLLGSSTEGAIGVLDPATGQFEAAIPVGPQPAASRFPMTPGSCMSDSALLQYSTHFRWYPWIEQRVLRWGRNGLAFITKSALYPSSGQIVVISSLP